MTTAHYEKDIGRFNQWSSTYEHSWMQRVFFDLVHRATLTLAQEIVQQPAHILDVGCGTGRLLRRAGACWPEAQLIGVDPAREYDRDGKTSDAQCHVLFRHGEGATPPGRLGRSGAFHGLFPSLARSGRRGTRDCAGSAPWGILSPGRSVRPGLAAPRLSSQARSQPRSPTSPLQSGRITGSEATENWLARLARDRRKEVNGQDIQGVPTENQRAKRGD